MNVLIVEDEALVSFEIIDSLSALIDFRPQISDVGSPN
jgi:hypothetical protein